MPKSVFYKIPEDRQLKLLRPALKEIVENPYEKITVSSLTDAMKILRTDFYYYFSDKDDIYQALLAIFMKNAQEYKENPTLEDALVALLDAVSKVKMPKVKQLVSEISENYHPMFAYEFFEKTKNLFDYSKYGSMAKAKVVNKVESFMTAVYLYRKSELTLDQAKDILKD